ncbi:phthiocerol/phenolphthiocerol synthesis type-I polyketide synthase D [Actinopolyspora mzabensis]|uniref:Phthiocerol/phenolphthiocerol synthesis type-I polyketide synthase D n=1 Tax=Actinopolyspora mzabensis TaxID=995066 RepID=A0A1G8Z9D2_ACTMZ|nr:type I polyketide synthase [Actinopolyspora mzabensis]SDK11661.1 phthiocerol/phenolphthiocerol synthesis type-I polyketide synthase D [Actinopolyspora mzabensis]
MTDRWELGEWLVHRIAERTGMSPARIETDRPFDEFGLSSRDVVALSGDLETLLGRSLPATLLWEFPTIERLAEALAGSGSAGSTVAGTEPAEPVAVIGLGCRFPGADGPERFWELLRSGTDAVGTVPDRRWQDFAPGQRAVLEDLPTSGGYLTDVAAFDAGFFEISPREAEVMDPQQRLLLEVSWEALENAGVVPERLRGSNTGVFVGVSAAEYNQLTTRDLGSIDAWTGTGGAMSVIANRLSYLLDLRGPSLAVDTACSSSLVALHQACASLRAGESRTALAGGVNLLLAPAVTANFHSAGALAADGRCKPFDAAADGIVRGEGCGLVVLKLLSEANRDGDRVHAVIRGSAVNSDGRSNGLMAPNPAAQEGLLRSACATADLDPGVLDYVEAHGTGTLLGDPIEARALGAVFGADRTVDRPLLLGSVKANLGHLEAAAGIAGIIKVVLAMRHGRLPATPHYHTPNPHIPFERARLEVVGHERPWPEYSGVARAGVSGFGFGGTNAHVVLESWPDPPESEREVPGPHTLFLSGSTESHLRRTAARLAERLRDRGHADTPITDIAHTLLRHRRQHARRGAVVGQDRARLAEGLDALAAGENAAGVVRGHGGWVGEPVWVFSGYGSQWPGMCRELLRDEPALAESLRRHDTEFDAVTGFSLYETLAAGSELDGLYRTQLGLFGTQLALAELWKSHGARPGAIIGHSMGEVAAAVAAGALDYGTGLRVMDTRTRLLAEMEVAGGGAMAVLEGAPDEIAELTDWFPGAVVAVHTSSRRCTVAGPADEIELLAAHFRRRDRVARVLDVAGAGHTSAVDPLLGRLREELADLAPATPEIPVYSTVEHESGVTPTFDADYWARNLRRPVLLDRAVREAVAEGFDTFVEIAPHPIVTAGVEESAVDAGAGDPLLVFGSRRDTDETATFRENLVRLHVNGRLPEPPGVPAGNIAELPLPVWEHQRYWISAGRANAAGGEHRLLGHHVELPDGRHAWQGEIGTGSLPWLGDHRVHDTGVLAGTGYLEMTLAAAARALDLQPERLLLDELGLHDMLVLAPELTVTTVVTPHEPEQYGTGGVTVEVHSRSANGGWRRHAVAEVIRATPETPAERDSAGWDPTASENGTEQVRLYPALRAAGQEYGPAFRPVRRAQAGDAGAVAELALPAEAGSCREFLVHPVIADGCLQTLVAAAIGTDGSAEVELFVPVELRDVRLFRHVPSRVRCHARLVTSPGEPEVTGSVFVTDEHERAVLRIGLVRARRMGATPVPRDPAEAGLRLCWEESDLPEPTRGGGDWLLFGAAPELAQRLRDRGRRVTSATPWPDGGLPRKLDEAEGFLEAAGAPAGVIVLIGEHDTLEARFSAARERLLRLAGLVRVLASHDGAPARLWLVSTSSADAELRALVRVLTFEHPGLRVSLLEGGGADAEALADELCAETAEDDVCRDGERRHVARLHSVRPDPPVAAPAVRPQSYLITGGLGGLGRTFARWLAERGAARVVLNGRRDPAPDVERDIERLRAGGTEVVVVTGDIGEAGTAERLVAAATDGGLTLCGVLHAAGTLDDGPFTESTEQGLERVWHAKVGGGLRLHEATLGSEPDWWVAFSSAAALLGSPGQAAYATANAALDDLVRWRRAQGLVGTSVQWGVWGEAGGASESFTGVLRPLSTATGTEAFEALLGAEQPVTGVAWLDGNRAGRMFPELSARPFFRHVVGEQPRAAVGTDPEQLRAATPEAALRTVTSTLTRLLGEIIGTAAADVDPDRPLTELGLDSLMAMRARNAVEREFGVGIAPAMLLRGCSTAELATRLITDLGIDPPGAQRVNPEPAAPRSIGARDATERWLAHLWREVLGLESVGVDQDFYRLGGDESLAEKVTTAVRERLGTEVPTLFGQPTIERMADLLRDSFELSGGPVRTLHTEGRATPLFLFHPAGGPTSVYQPLVERLGGEQPCYGMERLDRYETVPEKAAHYIELIREIQPEGPYRLGGWSFGGCLAFETARQLADRGEEVETLLLIDSILPLPAQGISDEELITRRFRRFVEHIEHTYGVSLPVPVDELDEFDEQEQLERIMAALAGEELGIGAGVLRHQYTSYVDARIAERYEPGRYEGPVVLYRAAEAESTTTTLDPRYLRADDSLGWEEYATDLEVVRVPGDHLSMIDPPHVDVMADHLRRVLGIGDSSEVRE